MAHRWDVLYSLRSFCLRFGAAVLLLSGFSSNTIAEELKVKLLTAEEARNLPFETVAPKKKIKVTVRPVVKLKPLIVKNEPTPKPEMVCPKTGFKKSLLIHHIQVAGGDSTFMRTPSGVTVLIGAGPKLAPNVPHPVIEVLRNCYQLKSLDYFIANNYSDSHVGGLSQILKKYKFKKGVLRNHRVAGWDKKKYGIKDETEIKNPDHIQFQALEVGDALGLVVRYGTFDYFIGGDLKNESQIADMVGDVDVLYAESGKKKKYNSKVFVETLSPEQVVIGNKEVFTDDHPLIKRLDTIPSIRHKFQTAQQRDVLVLADLSSYKIGEESFVTDGLVGSGLVTESAAIETYVPHAKLTGAGNEPMPLEEPDMDVLEEE